MRLQGWVGSRFAPGPQVVPKSKREASWPVKVLALLQGEDAAGHGVGHALLPALREGLVDGGAVAVGAAEGVDTGRAVMPPVRICSRGKEWVPISWNWFPGSGRRRR